MPKLIENSQLCENKWQTVDDQQALPDSHYFLPLDRWLAKRETPAEGLPFGVIIEGDQPLEALQDSLADLPLIAIRFPKFADGRGFSTARLLRGRHNYTGELRACGDIFRDQLQFLHRCGFDSFEVPDSADQQWLDSLQDFTASYQAAAR